MDGINVNFRDGVVDDGYMWVFDNVLQAVCRINLDTMVMDIVQKYEGEKDITIGWIVQHQNTLYMVTTDKPGILIYDKNKNRFYERFDVPKTGYGKPDVSSVLLHENTIWIFPVWLENAACCYDVKKGKFYTDDRITGMLKQHKSSQGFFSPFYYRENDELWTVSFLGNAYWMFDLKSGASEVYEFEDADIQLSGICCKGNQKWFSFINSDRIMCVEDGIFDIWDSVGVENRPFSHIANVGRFVLYMPRRSNAIVIIDTINNNIYKREVRNEGVGEFLFESMRNYCKCKETIYLFPNQSNDMYKMESDTGKVEVIVLSADFSYDLECVKGRAARQNLIKEDKNTSFHGFISYCSEMV